jgi:SAM-dependent methyltransferase
MAYRYREYWPSLHNEKRGTFSAVGYEALGEGFNRVTYGRRMRALSALLGRMSFPSGAICLEGACGVGAYAPVWNQHGVRHWIGVDISVEAVGDLQQRYPQHQFAALDLTAAHWGDLERNPGAASCDLVTGIDVLYHLVHDIDFTAALTNLGRFVRPGGYLVVSDVFVPEATQIADHVLRRPIAAYETILHPLGFRLEAREPVFGVLGDPVRRGGFLHGILFQIWRVSQKAIRTSPRSVRNLVGAAVAGSLLPLDGAVRGAGLATGRNLELALFRRDRGRQQQQPTTDGLQA